MPLKGPSFSGPTQATGWTASSLTPATRTTAPNSDLISKLAEKGWTYKPGAGWQNPNEPEINPATGLPFSYSLAGPDDINPRTLTPLSDESVQARQKLGSFEFGGGGAFGGAVGGGGGGSSAGKSDLSKYDVSDPALINSRKHVPNATPLEQLLASMFPDAAANYNPQLDDPLADPRSGSSNVPSLFNTILGNLGTTPSSSGGGYAGSGYVGGGYAPNPYPMPSIPGAPAFLSNTFSNLPVGGGYAPAPSGGGGPLNALTGISAIAGEQRMQKAEQEKAQQEAQAAYFQQQEKQKKQQAMAAQRQRQRSGSVSGWATNPTFF